MKFLLINLNCNEKNKSLKVVINLLNKLLRITLLEVI